MLSRGTGGKLLHAPSVKSISVLGTGAGRIPLDTLNISVYALFRPKTVRVVNPSRCKPYTSFMNEDRFVCLENGISNEAKTEKIITAKWAPLSEIPLWAANTLMKFRILVHWSSRIDPDPSIRKPISATHSCLATSIGSYFSMKWRKLYFNVSIEY